ncbi:MAG: DUF4105 domain-containing protein [Xanthomonadaceae bacterium]|nr:DUF4105 domain-containing protein [Xanthomonadaceae bacterium]
MLPLLWLAVAAAAFAMPARVGIVTMQPGTVFFERFGHNAILIEDAETGMITSYNFGFFDPAERDFIRRFLRGEMMYYMVALPWQQDMQQYQHEGRGATVQWLDLTPAQIETLAELLEDRGLPENARYRYDYFTGNCTTQVRDALNLAMDGELQSQLERRTHGATYRSEAIRLARPIPWMWLSFDLGLGPNADKPLSQWEDAFVPMRLADSLREAHNSEGRPLVKEVQELLPHRLAPEPAERPRHSWPWLLIGLGVSAAIIAAGRRHPRWLAGLAIPFWLICGLTGLVLLYLWLMTDHWAAWSNRNLLLLNPLCLLLLPNAWKASRGHGVDGRFTAALWSIAGIAALAMVFHWLPLSPQYNSGWIALLLPIHIALAWAFGVISRTSPPR